MPSCWKPSAWSWRSAGSRRWSTRAATTTSVPAPRGTVAVAHVRADQPDEGAEGEGHRHGAVLRREDAAVDRRANRREPGHPLSFRGRREERDGRLFQALRLQHRKSGEGAEVMDLLQFLYLPFLAGLILTGIHAYLGVHVVERGVFFVDLSLAQIAALGTTIAVLRGIEPHAPEAYWWSLGFTIIGAAIFATTRVHRETRIPQEAIIGIV